MKNSSGSGRRAAAEMLGKRDVQNLTLAESAILAGLVHQPEAYLREIAHGNYNTVRRRRDTVLDPMHESFPTRYSAEQVQEAKRSPVRVRLHTEQAESDTAYFADHVVESFLREFPQATLDQGPIQIASTIDIRLQRMANEALQKGLERLDSLAARSRHGSPKPLSLRLSRRPARLSRSWVADRTLGQPSIARSTRSGSQVPFSSHLTTWRCSKERRMTGRRTLRPPPSLSTNRPCSGCTADLGGQGTTAMRTSGLRPCGELSRNPATSQL